MIYVFVFLLLLVLSGWEVFGKPGRKAQRKFLVIIVLLITCISAIRWGGPGDFFNYKRMYDNMQWGMVFHGGFEKFDTEPLFNLLLILTNRVSGGNFTVFLFVQGLLVNGLFALFIWKMESDKEQRYIFLFMFGTWAMGLWGVFVVRQTIASVICLYSIIYIRKKSWVGFLVCLFAAIMFHKAALVWTLAYPIYHISLSRRWILVMLVTFTVFAAFMIKPMFLMISQIVGGELGYRIWEYLNEGNSAYGANYSILFMILKRMANSVLIVGVMFILYNRYRGDDDFLGCLNLYSFGFAITIGALFTSNVYARFATPYCMVSLYQFGYLFRNNSSNWKSKVIFGIYGIYSLSRLMVYVGSYDAYVPFSTIFGMVG